MKIKLLLSAVAVLSALVCARAETTVDWFNNSSTLLLDSTGAALPQGVAAINTDGALVQLGYFSMGTTSSNFAGTWIPITGFGPTLHTSIGDSSDNSGLGAGLIGFNTFFTAGSSTVQVYDATAGDTGQYFTQSSITISNTLPPSSQVLAIRFYNTTTGTSGFYNTVSSDTWLWQTPNTTGGGMVAINLGSSTLEFEASGPLNDFRTVIPVPEPSTFALLAVSALGLVLIRRRAKV
jgi:hypothetical protein